jgi:hypothetical protein
MDRITQANAALVEEATAASRSCRTKPMRWAAAVELGRAGHGYDHAGRLAADRLGGASPPVAPPMIRAAHISRRALAARVRFPARAR